ncbi:hypothetical protein [Acidocella sp.]|uniref:hypothetical protein n=1 Tax=Acidocella sp. TaxID=50710 RepID=UPI002632EF27|nr:hypothetical protein [Acidocella sp.]
MNLRSAALAFLLSSVPLTAAAADDQNWQDGVYIGYASDLFVGQTPAIIAFVKSHSKLAQDARVNLAPCPDANDALSCNINQTTFIVNYIGAFYGDRYAQDSVAEFLTGDGGTEVGISPNPEWGCAWRIVMLTSEGGGVSGMTNLSNYKMDCASLSESVQTDASVDAFDVLSHQISATMGSGSINDAIVDDYPGSP